MLSYEERQQLKLAVSAGYKARLKKVTKYDSRGDSKSNRWSAIARERERTDEGLIKEGKGFRCIFCNRWSIWNAHRRYRHEEDCVSNRSGSAEESTQAA